MNTPMEPTSQEPKPPLGKGGKTLLGAVLAAGLLAGGVFTGLAVADPTSSEEYATAVSHAQVAGADRDKYRGTLEELTTKHDTLVSDLENRESALEERESAVGEKEADPNPRVGI